MTGHLTTAVWDLDIVALTSIVHKDDSRTGGSTQALFRREKIMSPTGSIELVPIISGNAWRGVLRRIGEQLLAPVLDYAGELTTPAAHLLRNGGSLRKTSRSFTPEDERQLKTLVPLIGLFGGAANGRIMSGKASVSKVVPITTETAHLLPPDIAAPIAAPAALSVLGLESFSHSSDTPAGLIAPDADGTDNDPKLRYDLETLIAGTHLHARARATFATPIELAFFTEILDVFATAGHLGGRSAAGHGQISATITTPAAAAGYDWRGPVAAARDDALALLRAIT